MTSALGLSAEKITNLFLWGEEERPADVLSSSVIRSKDATGETNVNASAYMTSGPGKYASAADFDIVHYFFASNPTAIRAFVEAHQGLEPDEDAVLTEGMVRQFVGVAEAFIRHHQALLQHTSVDYAERVYIWETVAFEIDDGAEFVVTPDGHMEIRKFAIIPHSNEGFENFDFDGGWTANIGAPLLEEWVDPTGIGRTVKISFDDVDQIPKTILTKEAFYEAGDQTPDEDPSIFFLRLSQ